MLLDFGFISEMHLKSSVQLKIFLKQLSYDIFILVKLFFYNIYCYLNALYKNVLPMSCNSKDIDNEIVLVTGAAGGIGRNLVKRMIDLGCIVICIDNNNHELYKLKSELKLKHNRVFKSRVFFYCIDITSTEQIRQTAAKIKSEVGPIDIVINNAGIMNGGKLFIQLTEEEVTRLFAVNVLSQFWLCQQFLPDMIKANKGHIINVASVCGLTGGYKLTDYSSSKFAVVGFTESLRVELKCLNPDNAIVITTVCPFHVKTQMFNGIEFNHLKWLGLSMEPDYVAKKIVDGLLLNKELILIPSFTTTVFLAIKNLVTTKFMDYAKQSYDLNGSMDNFVKIDKKTT